MKKNLSKNLVKKSILPAAFAVMGSAIALTSVSYAWFTTGSEGKVTDMELKVEASEGLQLSTEPKNFRSTITVQEIKETEGNQVADILSPVSTNGKLATKGYFSMFHGKVSEGQLTATDVSTLEGPTGKFTCFDLYAQVTKETPFYLDKGSNCVGMNGSKIEMAARVAFINLGNAQDPTAASKLEGKEDLDHPDTGTVTIWEPFADQHTLFAQTNYETQGFSGPVGGTIDTYGLKKVIDSPQPLGSIKGSAYAEVQTTIKPEYAKTGNDYNDLGLTSQAKKLFNVYSGINKIRVYIWIEGQDVDCNNDVSNSKLMNMLHFTLNETPAEIK